MAAPRFFRLNQYNWLGQKLLVQHRYDDLLHLRHNLGSHQTGSAGDFGDDTLDESASRPLSDHLIYITGLALMKTSSRLDELIYALQKLNFQKNGQYFLLLCQCLLYLGNHDAVVALCKQILNKEISASPPVGRDSLDEDVTLASSTDELMVGGGGTDGSLSTGRQAINNNNNNNNSTSEKRDERRKSTWCLQQIYEESIEFRRIFESVSGNCLINDPRLWFVFALSLEFQLQFEDSDLAYRVACKLAAGQARQISSLSSSGCNDQVAGSSGSVLIDNCTTRSSIVGDLTTTNTTTSGGIFNSFSSIGISNYYTPHKNYGEFCIRYRGDYRTTMQILSQATQISPPIDYTLNPALALTLCSQANSSTGHFTRALEIINSLDNHSVSLRNPSFVYNQLALKCKQKLNYQNMTRQGGSGGSSNGGWNDYLERICDERRFDLDYVLIKTHIVINDLVQNSSNIPSLYKCPTSNVPSAAAATTTTTTTTTTTKNIIKPDQILTQIDKTLETLRGCNPNCWTSYALWNNLGVCYLLKRRYIASLSCLTKAHQLNPIDWRINYNLSLIYLHVGLPVRALCSSLASKNYRIGQQQSSSTWYNSLHHDNDKPHDPITNTMIAISYSELSYTNEARRFYAEMIALSRSNGVIKTPIIALINYLLLLHQDNQDAMKEGSDERNLRPVTRLLDLIEQAWLQRKPNDSQFAQTILDLANRIAEAQQGLKSQMKKAYAWTKFE